MSPNLPPTKPKFELDAPSALVVIIFLFFLNLFDWVTSSLGVINLLKIDPFTDIITSLVTVVIVLTLIYGLDFFLGRNKKNIFLILRYSKNAVTVISSMFTGKKPSNIKKLSFLSNFVVSAWLVARFIDWYTSFVGMYTWLVKKTLTTNNIDFVDFSVFVSDKGWLVVIILMIASLVVCLSPLALIYFISSPFFDSVREVLKERKQKREQEKNQKRK